MTVAYEHLARSALYVPGTRLDLVAKAVSSGADQVIVDLEDSVPVDAKAKVRAAVAEHLSGVPTETHDAEVWVRVNTGAEGVRDVEAVASVARGICLAKAETPADVEQLAAAAGRRIPIEPLVESAAAVAALEQLAACPGVVRLQLGEADLAADVGVRDGFADVGLAYPRSRVVFASAARGLHPPLAPVDPDFRDLAAFERGTRHLRGLGFVGRACIHPRQVAVANRVFTPGRAEVSEAEALLAALDEHAAAGRGAFVGPDGRMVDAATVRSARRVITFAERFGVAEKNVEEEAR